MYNNFDDSAMDSGHGGVATCTCVSCRHLVKCGHAGVWLCLCGNG